MLTALKGKENLQLDGFHKYLLKPEKKDLGSCCSIFPSMWFQTTRVQLLRLQLLRGRTSVSNRSGRLHLRVQLRRAAAAAAPGPPETTTAATAVPCTLPATSTVPG